MIGSRRVASNTTGPAALSLSTVPHTTVGGAAVVTCGPRDAQPVIPAPTAVIVMTAARAVILDFQRRHMPVRRGHVHDGCVHPVAWPVRPELAASLGVWPSSHEHPVRPHGRIITRRCGELPGAGVTVGCDQPGSQEGFPLAFRTLACGRGSCGLDRCDHCVGADRWRPSRCFLAGSPDRAGGTWAVADCRPRYRAAELRFRELGPAGARLACGEPAGWPAVVRRRPPARLCARWRLAGRGPGRARPGKFQLVVMIVEVTSGSTVVMKPAAAARSYFRFVTGFGPAAGYQLPAGDIGFTFAACPRGTPGPNGEVTDFYLGFSIKTGRAAPVVVESSAAPRPIRVIFTCPVRGCGTTG